MFGLSQKQYMLGTSFLLWSIHFLKGDDQYFFFKDNAYKKLPLYPFDKDTAHAFKRNLIYDLQEVEKFPNNSHCSFYCTSTVIEDVAHAVQKFLDYCSEKSIQTIYIDTQGTEDSLGLICIREKLRLVDENTAIRQKIESICPHFYHDKLPNDALIDYFNPVDFSHRFQVTIPKNIFTIQVKDYVYNGDEMIKKTLDFLQFECVQERFDKWKNEYYPTWLEKFKPDYEFCANLVQIARDVHFGKTIDFAKYNMNILKQTLLRRVLRDWYGHV